jgi:cell division protein FtsL
VQTEQVLIDIRERLVRVETKIDAQSDVKETASKAKETADEALDKAKSAQHRLDKIDKIIYWAATTVIGTIIVGMIAMYVKSGGGAS